MEPIDREKTARPCQPEPKIFQKPRFMDAEVARGWDAWAQTHIKEFVDQVLSPAIGEALAIMRKQAEESLRREVAKLSDEISELRSEIGLVRALKGGNVPTLRREKNGRDHAA